MNKFVYLIFIISIYSFCFSEIFFISDDYSHPLEELSQTLNMPNSILYANEINLIDSLNIMDEQDIIFWGKNIPFTIAEKEFITNFQLMGGTLSLFGKNIYDDDLFFINEFGGTFLRNFISNQIINYADTLLFENSLEVVELQQIGSYDSDFFKYNETAVATLKNNNYYLNGFWLEELNTEGRINYFEIIFNEIFNENVILEIGSIETENNVTLDFDISLENDIYISAIEIILNIENDYLNQFEIFPTERSQGFDWHITDLPFGNIKLKGEVNSDYIINGNGPIINISAIPHSNAMGKISVQIMESIILDLEENEVDIVPINGEINFTSSIPVLSFSENIAIELSETGIIELHLQNEMAISGFQFCLGLNSEEILFVQANPTDRVPDDWWVGQFGQGSNNEIQIASLGWSNLYPGEGPILEIEVMAVNENQGQSNINLCDVFLMNEDGQNLEFITYSTEVDLVIPEVFISPQIIHSENYSDLILNYSSQNEFSGYQLDFKIPQNIIQYNGYYESYITANNIGGTTYKFLGFMDNVANNFPENGSILSISFNYLNSLENMIEYDNLMFSDNQGEIVYSSINPTYVNEFQTGDVSGNGESDILDLMIIKKYIVDDLHLGLAQLEIADIDLNHNIDITDVLMILHNLMP